MRAQKTMQTIAGIVGFRNKYEIYFNKYEIINNNRECYNLTFTDKKEQSLAIIIVARLFRSQSRKASVVL